MIYSLCAGLEQLGCEVTVLDRTSATHVSNVKEIFSVGADEKLHSNNFTNLFSFIMYNFQALTFAVSCVVELNKMLSERRIDVIHGHTPLPMLGAVFIRMIHRSRIPIVYTSHAHNLVMGDSLLQRTLNFPEMLALKMATHVIAVTPSVSKALVSRFSIEPERITQVVSGVGIGEIDCFLSTMAPRRGPKTILNVGAISARKNQLVLVKAFAKLSSVFPEAELVLVGPILEPAYLATLRDASSKYAVESRVHVTGEVSREQLYHFYRSASVFAFPTTREMQGLVLLEAMAFGLPIVASRIPPIQDLLGKDERSFLLVDPEDPEELSRALVLALGDGALRTSMCIGSRKLAQTYTQEKTALGIFHLYQKLLLIQNITLRR